MNRVIPPGGGATVGILGAGQLGRMLALAAREMGYGVAVFSPERDAPAAAVADRAIVAEYDDLDAVRRFAAEVDVVTFEFENVPSAAADAAAEHAPVRPGGHVLHVAQHRLREKTFLRGAGLPVTPFEALPKGTGAAALEAALAMLGGVGVLKTAGFGYDGKGQVKLDPAGGPAWGRALDLLAEADCVLEAWVPFEREISVLAARGVNADFRAWPILENRHARHILDVTLCPAAVSAATAAAAVELSRSVLTALDVVGVLCVEMFLLADGTLLVNELAPRPHNSGHLTIEASTTSQFEQQLRAACGLPLGETDTRPAAMVNLLGDLWQAGPPDFAAALALPGVHLHLYGKREARPGRKMGHLTALADTAEQAAARALEARARLTRRG